MICNGSIKEFITFARCCSAVLADQYTLSATYGYPEKEKQLDALLLLRCQIRLLENYYVPNEKDFIEDGVKHLRGDEIILSSDNSLSLASQGQKIPLTADQLNCLSEDQLCIIVNNIKALCPDCNKID